MSDIDDEGAPLFGPTGISPPTHRGLLGAIGHSQPHDRGRRKCVGIVCLLIVIFLQSLSILPQVARLSFELFFNISREKFIQYFGGLFVIAGVLLYFLPMIVGLYADTYAGRYKALFFGIGLKLAGSILGFILVLVFESGNPERGADASAVNNNMSQTAINTFFALFVMATVFTMVGLVIILPSILTFAAQQVEPTFYGISSFVRWTALVAGIGVALSNFLVTFLNRPDLLPKKYDYYATVYYALEFGCDALSIAVFLFGKIQYTIVSTEEGENSWKEVVRLVKTQVCRSKRQLTQGDDIFRSIVSGQREQTLDKLKIRKAVLLVVLMACMAVSMSMQAVHLYIVMALEGLHGIRLPQVGWVRRCKYIAIILGAPIVELVFRTYGRKLKPDTTANQLRTIAVGTALWVITQIAGGVVFALYRSGNDTTLNAYWLIPQMTINGVASFIVYTSSAILCYLASPRGLGTFVCTILLCLTILTMIIELIIGRLIDLTNLANLETVFFSVAGALFVSLVIFYPVSRLYLRTEKSINDLLEPDDLDETTSIHMTHSREISRD